MPKSEEEEQLILPEKTISSKMIYQGRILSVREDTVSLPGGLEGKREIVSHGGAVGVVVETQEGIVLVRQYRKPLEEALWEIPAGKLEQDEDPIEAAKRETYEETGYRAGKLTLLTCLYTSPGFSDEKIYLYAADELERGKAHPDPDEFLEVGVFSKEKLKGLLEAGRIQDAKTVAGLCLYFAKTGDC
jgi:ADP-ribose pyrophosphatase